jgi:hypothetical protein
VGGKKNFCEQIVVKKVMNDKAEFDVMMPKVVVYNF